MPALPIAAFGTAPEREVSDPVDTHRQAYMLIPLQNVTRPVSELPTTIMNLQTVTTAIATDCERWETSLRGGAGLTQHYGIMARASEHFDVLCAMLVRHARAKAPEAVQLEAARLGRKKPLSQFTIGERVRLLIGVWIHLEPAQSPTERLRVERCRGLAHSGIRDTQPVLDDLAESDCPFHLRNALWWLVRTRNEFVHGVASEICEAEVDEDARRRDIGVINTLNFVRNLRDLVNSTYLQAISRDARPSSITSAGMPAL